MGLTDVVVVVRALGICGTVVLVDVFQIMIVYR